MGYKDLINKLESIDYSKYMNISSKEKLMIYAALILERNKIPITFNYLCIATFKIFPDMFYCDEEFKEFPSVDRLNRTLMHLKYVHNGRPYLTGSVENGYSITKVGRAFAEETEAIINNTKIDTSIVAPKIDEHKKGFSRDYLLFINSKGYKKYLETNNIDINYIWEFYKIIPYTQIKSTQENLNNILNYAKENNDEKCMFFIDEVLKKL